ncbi:MAG: hypothetical protein QNK11_01305 [Legionella sp.]|nr:hypothetical protein [Legionella sp.]
MEEKKTNNPLQINKLTVVKSDYEPPRLIDLSCSDPENNPGKGSDGGAKSPSLAAS